ARRHQPGAVQGAILSRYSEDSPGVEGVGTALDSLMPPFSENPGKWAGFSASRIFFLTGLGRLHEAKVVADSIELVSKDMALGMHVMPVLAGLAPASSYPIADNVTQAMEAASMKSFFPANFRVAYDLALGDVAAARRVLDGVLAASNTTLTPEMRSMLGGYRGWIKVLAGDTIGGVAEMKAGLRGAGALGMDFNSSHIRFRLAEFLAARAATREEGIRWLQNGFSATSDVIYLPIARLMLARALEDKGDRQGAANAYSSFIRLWEKADPSLQPRVAEARDGLKRTTGEASAGT
ncbi:MAG: hypothetical protein ABI613_08910, partial [Gemmatimonadota bacterium]